MGQYLVCFNKNKEPDLIFFDVKDFEVQNIKDMTILTFTEDDIDYTYFGTSGKDFKEAHKIAPDFDTYKLMTDKEAKKSGLLKNFPSQQGSTSSSTGSSTPPPFYDETGNLTATLDTPVVQLPDGKMVSLNDIMKMSPEKKKELEDMAKKMATKKIKIHEAKEKYYIAKRDGSFEAVSGTKLSNGLFAYKSDSSYFGWTITDIASGLLLKDKFKTLKDCKDYVAALPDEDKAKIERVRQGQKYLELCDKLAKYKEDLEDK